ncbi:MAG: response regulator transcription factor [Actinomycetota bacterium]
MTADAPKVLLVEDDAPVRLAVLDGLSASGFDPVGVASAEAGRDHLATSAVDLVVLDIGLPGMSGLELCQRVRAEANEVPILILSARDAVADRVEGLRVGADDYLVKPFDLSELVARLAALHRRSSAGAGRDRAAVEAGPIRIDLDRRLVTVGTTTLDLTRREFELLTVLVQNRDLVLSRLTLLEKVWGYDFEVETNVVDVFVGYLRKKLAAAGHTEVIRTVRGIGFVIDTVGARAGDDRGSM